MPHALRAAAVVAIVVYPLTVISSPHTCLRPRMYKNTISYTETTIPCPLSPLTPFCKPVHVKCINFNFVCKISNTNNTTHFCKNIKCQMSYATFCLHVIWVLSGNHYCLFSFKFWNGIKIFFFFFDVGKKYIHIFTSRKHLLPLYSITLNFERLNREINSNVYGIVQTELKMERTTFMQ